MADRAYIADENRDYINTHGNILDLEATPNKEIFFLTMALGMDEPKKLPTKKTGWILFKTFDTRDQALIQALRLGAEDVNEENINDFTDFDKCIDYAEQCSEAGFEKLRQMVADADGDNTTLQDRLMNELDRLYRMNVEGKSISSILSMQTPASWR